MVSASHRIVTGTVDGRREVTLIDDRNGLEAAFVPEAAMLCRSLRDGGEELLGQRHGLSAYVEHGKTMGIPLLHPWANRVERARFEVAGREVRIDVDSSAVGTDEDGLPIHGLNTAGRGWEQTAEGIGEHGASIEARLQFGPQELLEMFPFPHEVGVRAELRARTLSITTSVQATSAAGLPVSFGYHPYFALPGARRADWSIEPGLSEQLALDARGIPTGERRPAAIAAGPLADRIFDDAFLAPDDCPFRLSGGGRRIEVVFEEGYGYSQLFAPADDDVVAFEPMTAPTNAIVRGGPELRVLGENETHEARFSVMVHGD